MVYRNGLHEQHSGAGGDGRRAAGGGRRPGALGARPHTKQ